MKCFARLVVVFVALFALAPCSQISRANSPGIREKLDKRVKHYDTVSRPMIACVLELAYEYEIPIGIEFVNREAMTRPIDIQAQDQTVRALLTSIVQQIPDYHVSFADGLVEIFSSSARDDASNMLNRIVKTFSIKDQDAGIANRELACALARETDASAVCVSSIARGQLGAQKITLNLTNAKVYQIVNAIVAQNGKAAWTVIAPPSSLTNPHSNDLWHIYPLEAPFKSVVLDTLTRLNL